MLGWQQPHRAAGDEHCTADSAPSHHHHSPAWRLPCGGALKFHPCPNPGFTRRHAHALGAHRHTQHLQPAGACRTHMNHCTGARMQSSAACESACTRPLGTLKSARLQAQFAGCTTTARTHPSCHSMPLRMPLGAWPGPGHGMWREQRRCLQRASSTLSVRPQSGAGTCGGMAGPMLQIA